MFVCLFSCLFVCLFASKACCWMFELVASTELWRPRSALRPQLPPLSDHQYQDSTLQYVSYKYWIGFEDKWSQNKLTILTSRHFLLRPLLPLLYCHQYQDLTLQYTSYKYYIWIQRKRKSNQINCGKSPLAHELIIAQCQE